MYANEKEYPSRETKLEVSELSGMWKRMLGNTVNENTGKEAGRYITLHRMRTQKRSGCMIRFLTGVAGGFCAGATIFILWVLCAVKKRRKSMIEIVDTKMTRADKIRSMTNDEMADCIMETGIDECFHFCKNNEECDDLEPEERNTRCRQCLLEYLEGDYEES